MRAVVVVVILHGDSARLDRDVQPQHHKHPKREENPSPQLGNAEYVGYAIDNRHSFVLPLGLFLGLGLRLGRQLQLATGSLDLALCLLTTCVNLDGDGDLDLLITQIAGAPLLLRNDQKLKHGFLRIKLRGQRCNRDAIGAWVEVDTGSRILRRQVMPTRSYLSQVELPLTFGLGNADAVESVTVQWPGGGHQPISAFTLNGVTLVTQSDVTE